MITADDLEMLGRVWNAGLFIRVAYLPNNGLPFWRVRIREILAGNPPFPQDVVASGSSLGAAIVKASKHLKGYDLVQKTQEGNAYVIRQLIEARDNFMQQFPKEEDDE